MVISSDDDSKSKPLQSEKTWYENQSSPPSALGNRSSKSDERWAAVRFVWSDYTPSISFLVLNSLAYRVQWQLGNLKELQFGGYFGIERSYELRLIPIIPSYVNNGGGIGGLTLAAVLNKNSDVRVDVYEAKPVVSTIGAGTSIWKRSWQILQTLGLEDEVKKRKLPLPMEGEARGPIFRKADQPEDGFDFYSHIMPYGPTSIPRPMLLDMLQALLSSESTTIHTPKRLVKYVDDPSSDQPITLFFQDGSTATADVLIGADGVHSPTRATMYQRLHSSYPEKNYQRFIDPIWSGTYACRSTINLPKFRDMYPHHPALTQPKLWCGKSKHVTSVPFGDSIHLECYHTVEAGEGTPYSGPWMTEVFTNEIIHTYQGWEPDLLLLLRNIEKPTRWAIHVVRPIPFSFTGRVALLGDAAEAMTPHQGVGGGQAIEDAYILGHLLAHPQASRHNLDEILRVYQEVRLPAAAKAAELSRNNGLMYDFLHPDYPIRSATKVEDLETLGNAIKDSFEWLKEGD